MKRFLLLCAAALFVIPAPSAKADGPRIVNYVNFVRKNDYRKADSEILLYEATCQEVRLTEKYGIPATFLLQYDALISTPYVRLMKGLPSGCEVGAWLEMNRPHVEAAGLKWRGDHEWVYAAHIAFLTGYTPQEREKLIDAYMAKFLETFGTYPRSVGSWYIDAHSLAYMVEKYGVESACICRDQIGTDGYTLWGGYWNQAYYPSRRNTYMPAQTDEGKIDVPVFRMLGPDPIYQYDKGLGSNGQGCDSMEPVYSRSGADPAWVSYYMQSHSGQPCMAFSYVQVGQENSFTWPMIAPGLLMQMEQLDALRREGKIVFQSLGESGRWFRSSFRQTPATAVTALRDVRGEGRQSVWYNSRRYRLNLLAEPGDFRIRDIHLFDEKFASDYIDKPGTSPRFAFWTLPVVDGFCWSAGSEVAGLRVVDLKSGNAFDFRNLEVEELSAADLRVSGCDDAGNRLVITMSESSIDVKMTPVRPVRWALDINWAAGAEVPFGKVSGKLARAAFHGFDYSVKLGRGSFRSLPSARILRMLPASNEIIIQF